MTRRQAAVSVANAIEDRIRALQYDENVEVARQNLIEAIINLMEALAGEIQ